jgi:hypothetical protein
MITVRLSGGMGNQMFEYACARALALRNGTEVRLDLTYLLDRTPRFFLQPHFVFRNYDLDIFSLPQDTKILRRKYPPFIGSVLIALDLFYHNIFKPKGTERQFQFDESILALGDGTYLDGKWQSEKYFAEYTDVIRKDFAQHDTLSPLSQKLADEIVSKNALCVHVRRGDFLKHTLFNTTDETYFTRAVEEISKRTSIEAIYVFSDDIEWCRQNLSFSYPTTFVGKEYSGPKSREQFYLMRQCKHFVIPNSTFSWWAAWLSENPDKVVVAPKKWFGDPSINTSDACPAEWVRIP